MDCATTPPGDDSHCPVLLPDSTSAEVREGRHVTRRTLRCQTCGLTWEEVQ